MYKRVCSVPDVVCSFTPRDRFQTRRTKPQRGAPASPPAPVINVLLLLLLSYMPKDVVLNMNIYIICPLSSSPSSRPRCRRLRVVAPWPINLYIPNILYLYTYIYIATRIFFIRREKIKND